MNDNSNFDDLKFDSDFDELDIIGKNSDEVCADVIIDDPEFHNLDENEDSDFPENNGESLSNAPVTSRKEKQTHVKSINTDTKKLEQLIGVYL